MSLTKKDRRLRSKSGRDFPDRYGPGDHRFAVVIAAALKRDFGHGTAAVRTVARLVNVNDRAAKNWFAGKNAPNGELLVRLIEHSDGVLEAVLSLSHRHAMLRTKQLDDARSGLRELLARIDTLLAQ